MPANLPPSFYEAKDRYKSASEPGEELDALREMLSELPDHKGTDKVKADIRKRISKAKQKRELQKKKEKKQKKGRSMTIDRQGSGQIFLYGPPNSGKTTILNKLSSLDRDTGDYQFTTREPYPGMMKYENVDIQLVDMPPITTNYIPSWLNPLIRSADALCMVIDAGSENCLGDLEESLSVLDQEKVIPSWQTARIPPPDGYMVQPTLLIANKMDADGANERLRIIRDLYGDQFHPLKVSTREEESMERIKEELWNLLGLIRIYSRPEGREPDWDQPYTIPEGSTVQEFAEHVHRDIAGDLKFGRIWGNDDMYDGQRIPRDHVLEDEDQVELCF
jgi:ribosome-interacting GTPase 1